MSSEPRAPQDWEFPTLVKFLDDNLRPAEQWSITSEYPKAFALNNRPNMKIITEGDKIISHALNKFFLVKAPHGLFKIAGIGSVVTDPQERNKGYSSKIINSCVEAAIEENCDFAILWSEKHDFYRKLGFELAGREMSFLVNKDLDSKVTGLKVLDNKQIDPNAIMNLYNKHTVSSIRNASDISEFLNIPNSKLYTAWSSDNQLKAFAVEGKGSDLQSYIHEWGGGVEEILFLLSHIYNKYQSGVTIITPNHSQNLNNRLKENGLINHSGYLGMIKIISVKNIFFKLDRYARLMGINDLVLKEEENNFYIGFGDKVFKVGDQRAFTQLLFNPEMFDNQESLSDDIKEKLNKILPMNMWVWGWDSV